jgi:hypothetical protein
VNSRKVALITNTFVLVLVIFVIGFISFTNLVRFYVDEEVDYNEWTADLGNKFETDEATTFFEKFKFINMNGAARKIIGQREMNGIVKLMNGHLISPEEKKNNEEIKACADEVIKFAAFCKAQGKPFLFVQPNLKVDEDNKQLPVGVEDYSNENVNAFLRYLSDAGIDIIDIRKCMKKDGMDLYDYTYVTDHHWTTEACFYTFVKITEWIESETGVSVNPEVTDIDKYNITTYPKWHLGSYGQRVGEYFAGIDDYDLITPAFDVSFVDEEETWHSFYEQAVNPSIFLMRDAKSRYTYDGALHVPDGVSTTSQDISVLFVSDSYATAMAPYLKLAYEDYLFQYYPGGFSSDYVVQMNPDVVVLMPYITSTFSVDIGGTSGAVFIDANNK